MTPEEAYAEALSRIRKAEETGAVELDLCGLKKEETGVWKYTAHLSNRSSRVMSPNLVNKTNMSHSSGIVPDGSGNWSDQISADPIF
jgi:hypothetical protein